MCKLFVCLFNFLSSLRPMLPSGPMRNRTFSNGLKDLCTLYYFEALKELKALMQVMEQMTFHLSFFVIFHFCFCS